MGAENNLSCIQFQTDITGLESFYFSTLTTLEVTTLLGDEFVLADGDVYAYSTIDFSGSDSLPKFKTIKEFNRFFVNNPDYYIQDAKLTFPDNSELSSHDDGEVYLGIGPIYLRADVVGRILKIKGLPVELEREARNHAGLYLSLSPEGEVLGKFETFDDYLLSL